MPFMLYILAVAVGLLSFSLCFSWISFKLKTVNETDGSYLTGGFFITYLLLSMRLFLRGNNARWRGLWYNNPARNK